MKQGRLSEYFEGVAVKRLSVVEADPQRSHQHEFAGGHLREIFGDEDRKDIPTTFIWFSDEQEGISEQGTVSWYDSRRRQKHRSAEYRLYYAANPVASRMKPGDSFFVASRPDGSAMVVVVPEGSTVENQLVWLFGIQSTSDKEFAAKGTIDDSKLDFATRYILDELGIDAEEPEVDRLDEILAKCGATFPATASFSRLARESLPEVSSLDDPDKVLMAWLEREELLFRRLERHIVAERLRAGFFAEGSADVDGFIAFSLSVQNRRKSRAGYSLEHHLEALFSARNIRFERGGETENKNRPDFLFPGQAEYRDTGFRTELLTMLGAKSTCKDRWRQVLSEAERISHKHLLTLEPGISENQTDEMRNKNLQLVLPAALHASYRATQQRWLMKVEEFMRLVIDRQKTS